jgi:hypothetical protein
MPEFPALSGGDYGADYGFGEVFEH